MTDEVTIPAGMKPWGPDSPGYPDEPSDWNGDQVLFRIGDLSARKPGKGMCWKHLKEMAEAVEIIAYTPMTPEPAQPAESPEARAVTGVERARQRRAAKDASGVMYVDGSIYEGMEACLVRSGRTVAHVVKYADAVEIAAATTARPTERGAVEGMAATLEEYHRIMTTPFDPTKMTGVGYDRTMMSNARKLVAGLPGIIEALRTPPVTVAATDQAGEVERRVRAFIKAHDASALAPDDAGLEAAEIEAIGDLRAALDTQPATGRTMGGEERDVLDAAYIKSINVRGTIPRAALQNGGE